VSEEVDAYLSKARQCLDEAHQIAAIGLLNVASRSAYYALFHAAEALIFNQTGKIAKTHSGVRAEFARLVRNLPSIDSTLPSLLTQAYKYKDDADYSIRIDVAISADEVTSLMLRCARFIKVICGAVSKEH
jgi:uncharacterized protein (UPF0332 family)